MRKLLTWFSEHKLPGAPGFVVITTKGNVERSRAARSNPNEVIFMTYESSVSQLSVFRKTDGVSNFLVDFYHVVSFWKFTTLMNDAIFLS